MYEKKDRKQQKEHEKSKTGGDWKMKKIIQIDESQVIQAIDDRKVVYGAHPFKDATIIELSTISFNRVNSMIESGDYIFFTIEEDN